MEINSNVLLALLVTTLAGLSTGIGAALAFFTKRTNTSFLSISLGFSAGVMIYVAFVEILVKAKESIEKVYSEPTADWLTAAGFFGGILVILLIDSIIPKQGNPHEPRKVEDINNPDRNKKLKRMGIMTAIAIGIHNFPEGIATFYAFLNDPLIGITIAIAIAIHNIPEGIAVAVPIYHSTGNKKKSFWLAFSSGLAEPIGAVIGFFILGGIMSDLTFGILFASVAGIMVFISLDELLPTSREYDAGHKSVYGLIAGMAVMSFSLLILG